jgi:peptidoglycan/LPS O-acetylase OafA/YrhL
VSSTRQDKAPRIPELDGLRGVAIALVIMVHSFNYGAAPDHRPGGLLRGAYLYAERYIAAGWTGVDLFFVLSGFLIGGILLSARGSPSYFKTFYTRRFFRIIPLYYTWVLSYPLIMAVAGHFLRAHLADPNTPNSVGSETLVHLLFIQNFGTIHSSTTAFNWLAVTWSLAVEEQFYLVAPLVIWLLSGWSLNVCLAAAILGAPITRIWLHYHHPFWNSVISLPYMLTPCRADALALGIVAALVWRNKAARQWLTRNGLLLYVLFAIGLLVATLSLKWYTYPYSIQMESLGYTLTDLFCVLTLLVAIAVHDGPVAVLMRNGWLRELGRVSYCLYIVHEAVLMIFHGLQPILFGHVSGAGTLVAVLSVAVSYGIARASWAYFEGPLLRIGHNFTYDPQRVEKQPGMVLSLQVK